MGTASGFGLLLTRFAQAGRHTVIATSRNLSRTPELVAEIEGKGRQWSQLIINSTNSAQVIKVLVKSGHEIDVLAENAGCCIYAHVDTFQGQSPGRDGVSVLQPFVSDPRGSASHPQRWMDIIVKMSSGAALEARDNAGAKCIWAILRRFRPTCRRKRWFRSKLQC